MKNALKNIAVGFLVSAVTMITVISGFIAMGLLGRLIISLSANPYTQITPEECFRAGFAGLVILTIATVVFHVVGESYLENRQEKLERKSKKN